MFETYMKIGSNYYGTNDTIFVIERPQLAIDMNAFKSFWEDKPVISEIQEYKLKCLVMSGYEYIKQKMEEG